MPSELPIDVLLKCFEYLDVETLVTCSIISKEWRKIATNNHIWGKLYSKEFRHHGEPLPDFFNKRHVSMVEMYKQRASINKELSTRAKTKYYRNGTVLVKNNFISRHFSFVIYSIESVRAEYPLTSILDCPQLLNDEEICYFEASVDGGASIGIVAESPFRGFEYGFGSQHHVGWAPISYGYHSDDGNLYYNDESTLERAHHDYGNLLAGGDIKSYTSPWGEEIQKMDHNKQQQNDCDSSKPMIVGCGYDKKRRSLFFTLNGVNKGNAIENIVDATYYATLSLHEHDDQAVLNFGASPFVYDIESHCVNAATQSPPAAAHKGN